ncbi:MAG: trimeric intracellular cation channel family protein [Planctomycetota bacterium]
MIPLIELAAVASSALYGVLRGLRCGFDAVGLVSVSAATAFGGGTLLDLFLGRRPLFWIEYEYLLWVVIGLALVGAVLPRSVARVERLLVYPDAIGLGLFSVAGTAVALQEGMSPLIATLMGVVTGTFGGVICDIICNETPTLFRPSPLCATCALLGSLTYLGTLEAGLPTPAAQGVAIVIAAVFRIVAVLRNWTLPTKAIAKPIG